MTEHACMTYIYSLSCHYCLDDEHIHHAPKFFDCCLVIHPSFSPHLPPQANTDMFSLTIEECAYSRILYKWISFVWVLSLSILTLSFSHVVGCISCSFCLLLSNRHYFVNKGPSSQGYGFSRGHVWMWELDYKESWAPKNWCFWTVVLEKTLESPLSCKEIQPIHPKGAQSWVFIGSTDLKLKLQYFGHLMRRADSFDKTLMLGKIEGRRRRAWQDEMIGWHHGLDGHGFGWTPGVGDGQGGLECCGSWSRKELDTTERLNWTFICWWTSRLFPIVVANKASVNVHVQVFVCACLPVCSVASVMSDSVKPYWL